MRLTVVLISIVSTLCLIAGGSIVAFVLAFGRAELTSAPLRLLLGAAALTLAAGVASQAWLWRRQRRPRPRGFEVRPARGDGRSGP